jgi:hypothetical protein
LVFWVDVAFASCVAPQTLFVVVECVVRNRTLAGRVRERTKQPQEQKKGIRTEQRKTKRQTSGDDASCIYGRITQQQNREKGEKESE